MPSFKSGDAEKGIPAGQWVPAHERAFDPKTGEIYDGPDRAAIEYINKEGGMVGKDAITDPELKQASRNMGFNTVEEYLKYFEQTPEQRLAKKEANSKIVTHANPVPKPGVNPSKGGFYDAEKDTHESALSKKG